VTSPPTPSQTVGPFFHIGVDDGFIGPELVPRDHPAAVLLFGTVTDGEGVPVNDSMIEIWQANPAGRYAHPEDTREELPLTEGFDGFGRTVTNDEGRYELVTLKPGPVPGADGTRQAPHVDLSVFARGLLHRVVTRLYFSDEERANADDPVLAALPDDDARATLIAASEDGGYRLDIHLQGPNETVFFAL
jgi:protocatechuate 3,4-dioxygenase alpha subunit